MFNHLSTSIVRLFNAVVLALITVALISFAFVISTFNYSATLESLQDKAKNTIELASISLKDPIWNIDEDSLANIIAAILLDKDILAIQVVEPSTEEVLISKKRGHVIDKSFDSMLNDTKLIYLIGSITKEGEPIGFVHIVTSKKKAEDGAKTTTLMIGSFAIILLIIIGVNVWYIGQKIIKKPIDLLKEGAEKLAQGDLFHQIDTQRDDELGALSKSFEKMRGSIRKKIADLNVLNTTGEVLATLYDEEETLKTALKVMENQTGIEFGAVYLGNSPSRLEMKTYFPEQKKTMPITYHNMIDDIVKQAAIEQSTIYIPNSAEYFEENVTNKVGTKFNTAKTLLSVPMFDGAELYGVMCFSGYIDKTTFNQGDEDFAEALARLTVITTKNIKMLSVIEEQNRTLEQKVEERTSELKLTNSLLQGTLAQLQEAQEQVIQAEKMSSLVYIVKSLAHEMNTPLGIMVTAISLMEEEQKSLKAAISGIKLSKSTLTNFININEECINLERSNITKMSALIDKFKNLAGDNFNVEFEDINLHDFILQFCNIYTKNVVIKINLDCAQDIHITTQPKMLSTIITQLFDNVINHAYPSKDTAELFISVRVDNTNVIIKFSDIGVGIPQENIKKVFDPLFTTGRGAKNLAGLGLPLVYNIVQQLFGEIICESTEQKGTDFILKLPIDGNSIPLAE
jgi:signal transduction histidine kinase/HAMP domain-containing protein